MERLDRLRRIAGAVRLVGGPAFAAVAVIIIGTTIRMSVLQRSREIAIMRMIGASDALNHRTFILKCEHKGLTGGLLAIGLS